MKTFAVVHPREIKGQLYEHADELPPNTVSKDEADKLLDAGWLKEYDASERRSLHRLFHLFSGCKEQEALTKDELRAYALPS
jgi:hypothetical protein